MPELPPIPGGWTRRSFTLGARDLHLHLPKTPDLLLDDPQVIEANRVNDYMPYWSYLWPAAWPMAVALRHAPWPVGSRVLELGSGTGLVGLAALLRGDSVVFSDYDSTALTVCCANARANGLPVPEVRCFDWRDPPEERFEVVIGCEVTYDANLHLALLGVLDRMLAPGGICWLGDPGRYQAPLFFDRALGRGYTVRVLDESGVEHPRPRSNAFQIMELMRPDGGTELR